VAVYEEQLLHDRVFLKKPAALFDINSIRWINVLTLFVVLL
jgi:hypothetical protein